MSLVEKNGILSPDGSGILLRRAAAEKIQRTAGQLVIENDVVLLQISNCNFENFP